MKLLRQGDVLLIERPAPKAARATGENGLRVPGERTGHAHVMEAEVFEGPDGRRLLYLPEGGTMTHEEHAPLAVPAGWWEPVLQREFAPRQAPAARWRYD
jgi:hypothetical protein